MRSFITLVCLVAPSLASALPSPGMLVWTCRGCPNAMQMTHADVRLEGPGGEVGSLVVTHMVPETGGPSLEIENADTRVTFKNLQKQSGFEVRIHEGSCEAPGPAIHSVGCRNCRNSLAVKVLESQAPLHLAGDGTQGDLIGKPILFYDATRGSKLACGVVTARE